MVHSRVVSVWFRSKERPGKSEFSALAAREMKRAPKNETFTCAIFTLVPRSLLLNRAETLTAHATVEMSDYSSITIMFL